MFKIDKLALISTDQQDSNAQAKMLKKAFISPGKRTKNEKIWHGIFYTKDNNFLSDFCLPCH
jgi:hypothetical protein